MTKAANVWDAALKSAIELISAYMDSRHPVDTAPVREAIEVAGGKLRVLQEKLKKSRNIWSKWTVRSSLWLSGTAWILMIPRY